MPEHKVNRKKTDISIGNLVHPSRGDKQSENAPIIDLAFNVWSNPHLHTPRKRHANVGRRNSSRTPISEEYLHRVALAELAGEGGPCCGDVDEIVWPPRR